jgi:dTDP-4-dehydrorhamnose reductase
LRSKIAAPLSWRVEEPVRRRQRQELDRSHRHGDRDRSEAKVFTDRTGLAELCERCGGGDQKARSEHGEYGLYHCVGTGFATWLEVGREIARILGKDGESHRTPISVADVPMRASRRSLRRWRTTSCVESSPSHMAGALRRYLS